MFVTVAEEVSDDRNLPQLPYRSSPQGENVAFFEYGRRENLVMESHLRPAQPGVEDLPPRGSTDNNLAGYTSPWTCFPKNPTPRTSRSTTNKPCSPTKVVGLLMTTMTPRRLAPSVSPRDGSPSRTRPTPAPYSWGPAETARGDNDVVRLLPDAEPSEGDPGLTLVFEACHDPHERLLEVVEGRWGEGGKLGVNAMNQYRDSSCGYQEYGSYSGPCQHRVGYLSTSLI